MVIWTGSDAPFVCSLILPTLDWLWGCPQALIQHRHVSSDHVGLAYSAKPMPLQNWGNLLSELHVPHEQCLTGISDAFSAFFKTSICPSSSWVHCTPNKSVPTLRYTWRHYWVQSPGFPKIVYCMKLGCTAAGHLHRNMVIELVGLAPIKSIKHTRSRNKNTTRDITISTWRCST